MKEYNIDFLVAGLVLLLLILYHFMRQKKLDSSSTRIFWCFITVGISDVLFDLLSTLLIAGDNGSFAWLSKLCLTTLYFLQILVPLSLVYYAMSLRNLSRSGTQKAMMGWTVIPTLMAVTVLFNYWNGWLFYFDSQGLYHRGPAYMLMYYYAVLYAAVVGLVSVYYRKELGKRNVWILWEFLLLEGICTMVQAFTGKYLMTGFGISLGITILYLTISNPGVYIDNLTGVFGKLYFAKWFQEQVDKGKHIHMVAVHVRNLKQINKIFGNSSGDQLLVQLTERLSEIGDNIKIFRISGRRLLLMMQSLSDYEKCRDKTQEICGQTFLVNGEQISISWVICGIVNGETLKEADMLLAYLEYMSGLVSDRERTALIQSSARIMEGFLYEQEIERFLETALEQDLFEVYYQPVYSISEGEYVTLEALSRLRHPALGYIPPDVFITLAEKNGYISRIGNMQFRKICRFIKENERIMDQIRNVKVNLSPLELLKHGHIKALMDIIREYELKYSYFQFEITETVATEYSENLIMAADEFLKAGIGLCLDDFGSGFANLNTVLKLPFSAIKIDRSLLVGAGEKPHVARFYQNIVSILKDMGYQIVAEGAETKEDTELLRSWGVDMIQGFYFSKPVNEETILELLGRSKV